MGRQLSVKGARQHTVGGPALGLLTYLSGRHYWIALAVLLLFVIVFKELDTCFENGCKKNLSIDFGGSSKPFIIENDTNKRVTVEALAFNHRGEEITLEEVFTVKPPFSFKDYYDLHFYSVPKKFKAIVKELKIQLESRNKDVPITEEELALFEDLRRLSKRLNGNRVTLKITHTDTATGEDLTVQETAKESSQNDPNTADNVSRSSSKSLNNLRTLTSSLKSIVSRSVKSIAGSLPRSNDSASYESSSIPKFFIQDHKMHFAGARCERLILIPENLEFSGKKVSQDYSKAGLDSDDVQKCERVAIVGNNYLQSPFVWKPLPTEKERDFQNGRKLAFNTALSHANLIAQYTPRPGAISVAQDEDGNAMFAMSVRGEEQKYFNEIKSEELKKVLETISGKKGDGHGYCSEQVITHNVLVLRKFQMKTTEIPTHFATDKKIAISAFGKAKDVQYNKSEERYFNSSKLVYNKRIPACLTCKITNKAFGFTDMHEDEHEYKDEHEHWRIHGGAPGAPPGSKFFHFHAVFSKNLKNNSNFGSWRTPLGKILDPPLMSIRMRMIRENLMN